MYKKMKKETIGVKTGLAMALFGSVVMASQPLAVFADTAQEISQEKQKVDDKIQKIKEDMKLTEIKVEKMKKNYEETEAEIKRVDEAIRDTQERIEKRTELLGSRLTTLQQRQSGLNPYLEVLINSDNFSDLIGRMYAVSKIMNADQELIDAQTKDEDLLKDQKQELLKKRNDFEKQFQTLQEEVEKLETQKAEQEVLSLELDNKLEEAKEQEARLNQLASLQKQSFEKYSIDSKTFSSNQDVSEKAIEVIHEASKYLGNKYVWGGSSPKTSFDCSGLTQWSYKQAGINLPRTAAQQYLATESISVEEVKPGDLVFFSYGSGIAHVGIYIGDGKMLNAQNSGIKIANLEGYWEQYIAGFGRVAGVN